MPQPKRASLLVHWVGRGPETIPVQYNPTEINFEKSVQLAEIAIPGLDMPLQQFVRGQAEKLTLELFFDTTDDGMGQSVVSVTTKTDQIYQLIKIEPERHAPPICTFLWSDPFPGGLIGAGAGAGGSEPTGTLAEAAAGGVAGAAAGAAVAAAGAAAGAAGALVGAAVGAGAAALGNQRRTGFKCVVESIRQKFTLFSTQGVPLRATLTVVLREYQTLEDQLQRLNLTSPDRTHSHVIKQGETLDAIAARYYERSTDWRQIADANDIEDPRRLTPGIQLTVPPTR